LGAGLEFVHLEKKKLIL
jgi:hypothetical protein